MKRTKIRLLFFLMFAITMSNAVFGQEKRKVSGQVNDETGKPLFGVSISVKGAKAIAATDENGRFNVALSPSQKVLIFSFVGFASAELDVSSESSVTVSLKPAATEGAAVVVTALGVKKVDRKLGYAVTSVKAEDIQRTNTVSPIAALQGKVAGVNINVMGASGVQSSPSIMIRGAKSLRQDKNQAMFVIDGMVIENNTYSADDVDQGSQLKNLNPDDYESITVLKGAAATSLYGSRGANGAIVITTKKGRAGQGLGIGVVSTYQYQQIYRNGLPLQDVYGNGAPAFREGNFKPDGTQVATSNSFGPRMDGSMHPAIYDNSRQVPYSPQPDNWKAFYQNGNYINNNISLSGGGDKFTYRLSYSNLKNQGTLPNNKVDRNSFDLKTTAQLNKIFSVDAGINYSLTDALNPYGQGRYSWPGGSNLGFLTYYSVPRNTNLADWRNNYRNADGSMKTYGYSQWDNVVNGAFNRFDKINTTRSEKSLLANVLLKAQLTNWLDISGKANLNLYRILNESKEGGSGAYGAGGFYSVGGEYNTGYNYLFMAHMAKKAVNDNLDIDFRVVNEYYGNGIQEKYGARTDGGLIVPNVFTLSNSVNALQNYVSYTYGTPNNKVIGVGGILTLGWKDYLNVELTGRNDWLSSLTYPATVAGDNNYSVFYPSVNVSWAFSDMWKDKMPSWLSFGKLRASVAWVGNGTDPYATSFGSYQQNTVIAQNGNSIVTADLQNSSVLPNLKLKPENQRSIEIGTNLSFFKELFSIDFAYYKTNTFNQILTIPGILETGYSSRRINAGNIQNQGMEILLNATPFKNRDLRWDVSVNFTRNRGKVVKFYPGISEYAMFGDYDGAGVYAYEGGSFGQLTANFSDGGYRQYDTKTGLPIIRYGSRDKSTDPETKHDYQVYDWVGEKFDAKNPRRNIGNVEPDFLAGFNTTLRYKQFSLYAQIDSRFGGWIYSESYNYGMGRGNLANSLQYRDKENGGVERTDTYTGQTVYNGVIPNAVFAEGEKNANGADIGGLTFKQAYDKNLVEPWQVGSYYQNTYGWGTNFDNGSASKMSWIVLRELSLSYKLPVALISKIKLKSANFTFTARNVAYLYNSLTGGQNPESIQSNNPFNPFITGAVPFSRNFALSLNINL